MQLGPCPSCRRHVRIEETACPFCGASSAALALTPGATSRMSRARLFAFATTVGLTTLGCPEAKDPGKDGSGIVQPYGAPPTPTPPDTGAAPPPDAAKP